MFNNFDTNCLTSFTVDYTTGASGSVIVLSTVYTVEVLAKYPSNATISGRAYGTSSYVDFGSGNLISKISKIIIIKLY